MIVPFKYFPKIFSPRRKAIRFHRNISDPVIQYSRNTAIVRTRFAPPLVYTYIFAVCFDEFRSNSPSSNFPYDEALESTCVAVDNIFVEARRRSRS